MKKFEIMFEEEKVEGANEKMENFEIINQLENFIENNINTDINFVNLYNYILIKKNKVYGITRITVRQIVDLIDCGKICYDQSTQRKFVYGSYTISTDYGEWTRSAMVVTAIIREDVRLPGVMFWNNTETNQINIHDGKQRILSIYNYIKGNDKDCELAPIYTNRGISFADLKSEDQEKLLNYSFAVEWGCGPNVNEERNFYEVNTHSVDLTSYECIYGQYHGKFLRDFERYITAVSEMFDNKTVKRIGRGNQAYLILLTMFDKINEKGAETSRKVLLDLSENYIARWRNNEFKYQAFHLDQILDLFDKLHRLFIKKGKENSGKEKLILQIAKTVIKEHYDVDDVYCLYSKAMKDTLNDIDKWDYYTHMCFIKQSLRGNIKMYPTRFFSKQQKNELYEKCGGRCEHVGENGRCTVTGYDNLQVDHIIPWALGGETTIVNGQLYCPDHNKEKGTKSDKEIYFEN